MRTRPLYKQEQYFRHEASGETNLSGSEKGNPFVLKPFDSDEIYNITQLDFVIIGNNLLKDHSKFGEADGTLTMIHKARDDYGISFDWLSTGAWELRDLTDFRRYDENDTKFIKFKDHTETIGVKAPRGYIMGDRSLVDPIDVTNIAKWVSVPKKFDFGNRTLAVGWHAEEAQSLSVEIANYYDLFIRSGTKQADGSYSWNPWQKLTTSSAVFNNKVTDVSIIGDYLQIKVEFKLNDPIINNPSTLEELIPKSAKIQSIVVYAILQSSEGIWHNLRELIEDVYEFDRNFPKAFRNEDIVYFSLPYQAVLDGSSNDYLSLTLNGGTLTEMKVKARGEVIYEIERKELF